MDPDAAPQQGFLLKAWVFRQFAGLGDDRLGFLLRWQGRNQVFDGFAQGWMPPTGGYFRQRQQYEGPILHPRMWQGQFGRVFGPAIVIDDIEVERPGGIAY
jgi:hypothetical protein